MEPTPEQANERTHGEPTGNERPVDTDFDASRIAQMLQVRRTQVEKVARLLAEGHEPPFIARHRRDMTLGLPEEAIWRIHDLTAKQKAQAGRRREIIATLTAQGRLTPALEEAINESDTQRRLEDIQAHLRPRRRSISAPFREKGLNNLAEAVWLGDPVLPDAAALEALVGDLADPERGIGSAEEIREGLKTILAEVVADAPDIRSGLRQIIWETARVRSARNPAANDAVASEHKDYWQFSDTLKQIPAHRVLGLGRAERSGAVTVS
ncbi:MAG: Tex-like N-terminal domain-containing protein, partial [Gemmataceae bacterium]